ncbi:putative MORN repeat-containing protein [Melbournevirus]|uniref:putative MORN repeat-containing protein n=1 Tax=Melbournevirus TaxID=1560514 RepID=UPI00051F5340|nr:putative MORN repeat-containing protein [Melbournevirus]AIT54931.1 MORN repeat-containing protein [Melbournevirus]
MDKFLRKRDVVPFVISGNNEPEKGPWLKFFATKHRSFWRLPGGEKHGPEEIYRENGSIKVSRTWKYGKLHGEELVYDVAGEMNAKTTWKEGKKDGERYISGLTFGTEQFWKDDVLVYALSRGVGGETLCKNLWGVEYIFCNGELHKIFDRRTGVLWVFGGDGSVKKYCELQ